jgi:integrase/recombinase XerD
MDKIKRDKLQELVNQFLLWCEFDQGQKDATLKGKRDKLKNLLTWLQTDLTLLSIENYKHHLIKTRLERFGSEKERVLNGVRTDLKSNIFPFISWLHKKEYLKEDWKSKIDLPPTYKKDYPVQSSETIDRMIEEGTHPGPGDNVFTTKRKLEYKDALIFMARTGCRVSVVLNLQKEDVNIASRQYKAYTKGRIVHLAFTEDLVPMLQKRCVGSGKVFDIGSNKQMLNEYIHRGAKKLGVSNKFVVHTLRHSKATNLLTQGADMSIVQKVLGHESIKTTIDTYAHLSVAHVKEIMDLDPQVQKALTLTQKRKNIRRIIEMSGLTRIPGVSVKFTETDSSIDISFEGI